MNSRMERYKNVDQPSEMTRSRKNQELYETMDLTELSRIKTNDNVKIIESSGKEIDLDKIKNYVLKMNKKETEKRENLFNIDNAKIENNLVEDNKDYDINSVLEKARANRKVDYEEERHKKLNNTQYDILSKIKMYEEPEEDIEEEFNTEERCVLDLINTVTIHKEGLDLLSELTEGSDNTEVVPPIDNELINLNLDEAITKTNKLINEKEKLEKEIDKEIEKTRELVDLKEESKEKMEVDNSFFTSSMSFSKDDFEGFEELEKSNKKNNAMLIGGIIFLIISIIITIVVIAMLFIK